ncbi:MAG TPA: translocation/assembly module TamB domain-containing protein, partial [Oceanipulchritudo sp.]|nr:translocation/assembly module TamB domain-containing protein [Oceanipulchritudo sp.]
GMHPFEISGNWEGRIPDSLDLKLESEATTGARLAVSGSLQGDPFSSPRLQVRLSGLKVQPVERETFRLKEPVELVLALSGGIQLEGSSHLILEGMEGGILEAAYAGAEGTGRLVMRGLQSGMLGDWITADVPDVRVDALDLDLGQMVPSVHATWSVQLSGTETFHEGLTFSLEGALEENGLRLGTVKGLIGETPVLSGSLKLPFALKIRQGGAVAMDLLEDGLLGGELQMEIQPERLQDMAGIPYLERMGEGMVNLELGGSPGAPEGDLKARLTRLELLSLFDEALSDRPFRDLELDARMEPGLLTVRSLQAALGKARLDVSGDVGTESLLALLKGETVAWREVLEDVRGDLVLKALRAEQVEPILPEFLRPRGFLDGELHLGRGLDLKGQLRLAGFSMRPTLYSQTIDDIRLFLNLDGSRATLSEAGARIGESPVGVDGFLDFRDPESPFYRLKLSGTRMPLIRTASMLVQGDLDLLLERREAETETLLSGAVTVVDSVLLLDIDPLAPRTAGGALPRPPFFRIEEEPFADWQVDLSVSGRDSLRLRSQYAEALLSLDFQLEGRLSLPLLVGGLETGKGSIFFPATKLALTSGEIFVTRSQQDAIQLELAATGGVASHVVTMGVNGTLEEPLVRFASTPDLSNAEIFRLLATGSLKSEGYGSVGLFLG